MFRINGSLLPAQEQPEYSEIKKMIDNLMGDAQKKVFAEGRDVDFAYRIDENLRLRVNVFRYANGIAASLRLLNNDIPSLQQLGLPEVLNSLVEQQRGLILITGPTGSGKSTTLASMIDHINETRAEHIITIEDPIEYIHHNKLSIVHQREAGRDVSTFAEALRSSLREDPDIILVGEMRDYETISAAVTAAETGHLVMSTLHTTGAAQTIDRIIDVCPPNAQNQIRTQHAGVLSGVITQCLIPNIQNDARHPATEVLIGSDAVLNMIRENKCFQLPTAMQSAGAAGMHTLNNDLARLVKTGKISVQNAYKYSNNKKELEQYGI